MPHFRSTTRAIVGLLAALVSSALVVCGVAAASITLFEPPLFSAGPGGAGLSVNGQSGVGGFPWKSSPPGVINCLDWPVKTNPPATHTGQYDQEVVPNGLDPSVEFGVQSLRMSNACGSGEFNYQTYSPAEPVQVGENRVKKVFMAQFSFMSTTPDHQPGLFLSVSPDSHEGSRMSWVGLQDTAQGIRVTAADAPDVDGEFVDYDLGLLEDRTAPHTIRFWIKVNPGPDNDLVRIALDGRDVGQCFTTWENYYRTAPEQAPPPNVNTPADINSLQFRSSAPGPAALATSGGYLFDNVSLTPQDVGPKECSGGEEVPPPVVIDKSTPTRVASPGDLITYRLSVRNRSNVAMRSVRACDQAPRALAFLGATVRLRRAEGRRLCLTIPLLRPDQRRTFRATFRLRANVTADTVPNEGTVDIPGFAPSPLPPDAPPPPPGASTPPPGDPDSQPPRRPLDRDSTTIRVRPGPRACPAAQNHHARAAC